MSAPVRLPIISREVFLRRLKGHPHEDLAAVRMVESFFMRKRGYVFRMPPPGTPVILLVSGGLDSTNIWDLLLSKYKLIVFPLYVFRDRKRSYKEARAVEFFDRYFQKRYPRRARPVKTFTTVLSPPEIVREMQQGAAYYHPNRLFELIGNDERTVRVNFYPQRVLPFLHVFYALVYGQYLREHQDTTVFTVFTSILPTDGATVPSQTFTSLRTALLAACHTTGEYRWQYASLPFEKEAGHYWRKQDLIAYGASRGLPLEKTWTCYHAWLLQCGDLCLTCRQRKEEFARAGVPDRTPYLSNSRMVRWLGRVGIHPWGVLKG